jgi:outer membrane protein TolC
MMTVCGAMLGLSACHQPFHGASTGSAQPSWDSARPAELPGNVVLDVEDTQPIHGSAVPVDPAHAYSLAELIDLAQRTNPSTRIAWEQARQAADAVGLVEATYLPQLSAEAVGGLQRAPMPVPTLLDAKGNLTADMAEIVPSLVVEWLLFDFGQRDAQTAAAQQMARAARVGFSGAHQKLIFEVSKAYFALDAERSQLRVAESALASAHVLQEAAEARHARGLATMTEVATARRGTAKAVFDLEQAKAVDNDTYHGLLEVMGLRPTLKMTIVPSAGRPLPRHLSEDVDSAIRRALTRRPDIVAALAKMRASEAEVAVADAADYPKIGLVGTVGENIASLHVNPSGFGGTGIRANSVNEPAGGIMLSIRMPLFDGGLRDKAQSIARSKRIAAEEDLSKAQDEAVRQVARTYDSLTSALAQHDAAKAFVAAAEEEAQSSLESYRQGVGTLTVASTAETERTRAQSAQARAYADILTAAAALAFATGDLTSVDALNGER